LLVKTDSVKRLKNREHDTNKEHKDIAVEFLRLISARKQKDGLRYVAPVA